MYVLSGVPQGSVLGPLLFLIHIDDILQHVDYTCRLYVDDCILYQKIEPAHDIIMLQNDLYLLKQWEKWEMSFNVDKCMVLSVTQKRIPIQGKYFLHNTELKMTECAKYLGVKIDSKLSTTLARRLTQCWASCEGTFEIFHTK